ncbi:hypothetical protein C8Q77DRAFT_1083297 [Trametes polyzona]|nr:hypothetical protein C8Q77DRAFT_1083297 [Trametes polyzona]
MSRGRVVPFLVAGVTGVLSGIYIFKPLFDQNGDKTTSNDVPPPVAPSATAPPSAQAAARGESSPLAASNTQAPAVTASDNRSNR